MITDDKNFEEAVNKATIASNNDQKRLVMIADIIEEIEKMRKSDGYYLSSDKLFCCDGSVKTYNKALADCIKILKQFYK